MLPLTNYTFLTDFGMILFNFKRIFFSIKLCTQKLKSKKIYTTYTA